MRLFNFLFLILTSAYTLVPSRPMNNISFWVDNRFSPKQLQMIRDVVTLWSLNNGNRMNIALVGNIGQVVNGDQIPTISKGNDTMAGNTVITSQFGNDLMFHIYDVDVTLNGDILGDTDQFYNAFLHEAGHCQGLYHNSIKGSIMNVTIYLDSKTGRSDPTVKRAGLHIDDLYGNYQARHATEYKMLKQSKVNHVEYRVT